MPDEMNSSFDSCLLEATHKVTISVLTLITATALSTIITIFANAIVIIAFLKQRSLQCPANLLLCSLSVSDLLVGFISKPLYLALLVSILMKTTNLRELNMIFLYSMVLSVGTSLLHVFLITSDRFLGICTPFIYQRFVTCKLYIYLLAGLNSLLVVMFFVGPTYYYSFIRIAGLFGFILMTIFYMCICVVIRRQQRLVFSLGEFEGQTSHPVTTNTENKSKIYTIVLLLLIFLACNGPALHFALRRQAPIDICTHDIDDTVISLWTRFLLLLNSTLNPIVYCYRMTCFRSAVKKLFE